MAAATLVATSPTAEYIPGKLKTGTFQGVANAMDNSGVQDIFTLDVRGMSRLCVRLVVATNALAAIQISALVTPNDSTYILLASASGDFTTAQDPMIRASADLTTLATGSGWFILNVTGLATVKISANSSAVGGSTLAMFAGGA